MRLIAKACENLDELGSFDRHIVIQSAARHAVSDGACLNLQGVACELLGDLKGARQFYARAIRADGGFQPARQNMQRLYELNTFGGSSQSLVVGHALTDLLLQRRDRTQWPTPSRRS